MGATAIQSALGNPLIVVANASAIGVFFGRNGHKFADNHQHHIKPLMVVSTIMACVIALIWCGETGFAMSWLSVALTWMPQEFLLVPPAILLVCSLFGSNQLSLVINIGSLAFVSIFMLGGHVTMNNAVAGDTVRVMTFDVDQWANPATDVVKVVEDARPTVFCLEESGSDHARSLQVIEKQLPSYRFLHRGGITIGSKYRMREREVVPLLTSDPSQTALVATVYGEPRPFVLVALTMLACDKDKAAKDPGGYLNTFIHARTDEANTLLTTVKDITLPMVICGDFNGPPQSIGYRDLSNLYTDAFAQTGSGFGFTAPASLPMVRSDAVLLSGMVAHAYWVPRVPGNGHRPAVVDVSFAESTIAPAGKQ
ncbi:MAG: endonuclease/exonuclease/phosphatase family protein [Capsulimonadaceae bacterium]